MTKKRVMVAYRISDIAKPRGPIGKSTIYRHAAAGRLRLRKVGGVTVVFEGDWCRYLTGEAMISKQRNAA